MTKRSLIVNADDFGQTPGVNRGIVEAHEHGIVTSASLLVRFPAAEAAADYARRHKDLSTGLHIDFGEWTFRDERWEPIYEISAENREEVDAEIRRQLAEFRRLTGQDPSHLDSHQHAHLEEPVRSVVLELRRELGVPLRELDDHIHYRGHFYGQAAGRPYPELITVDALIAILRSLPPGVTELGCHPGYVQGLESTYLEEREREIKTLCHPRVRAVIEEEGIELRSFRNALA